ncbi:MAG: acetyl-CoA carboxylase biotin carboxyl carrier protein [Planctomycetia bacterium]|nr:acetyl-CoA carboxylase biotin carboxyl carrier protein [Planctomycetia bacterium]
MVNDKKANVFDIDKIRQLVELMKENDISEVDLQEGSSRIQLQRKTTVALPAAQAVMAAPAVKVNSAPAEVPAETKEPASVQTINSSLVGTFYASANPDTPPYVKVGDIVAPDQTVCIIEAMKVFNEIQAEISGKIVAVLVKNGQAVEFGTPLFKVDTKG